MVIRGGKLQVDFIKIVWFKKRRRVLQLSSMSERTHAAAFLSSVTFVRFISRVMEGDLKKLVSEMLGPFIILHKAKTVGDQ